MKAGAAATGGFFRRSWRTWRGWPLKKKLLATPPAAFLGVVLLYGVAYALAPIPKTSDVATAQSTVVMDRTGAPIARLHAEVDRVDVAFDQMPRHIRNAVLAAEDKDFYRHGGVSISAVVRAAFTNLRKGEVAQGGSTITQQYVKNAYVGNDRTFVRKFKELIIAQKLERSRTKDEILEDYLNTVYFGRGAYGVEAAARTFFGKAAKSLSVADAAYMAGVIRSPETYARDVDLATKRRNQVLQRMVDLKMITAETAEEAREVKVVLRPRRGESFTAVAGPHFVEDVRRALVEQFGSNQVYRGGLRVTTTLDLRMQRAAEKAAREVLDRKDDPEAALVSIDPKTGAIRAMVGGRSFQSRQLNLASQGKRQPGSSFKPFVLAAALEDGMSIRSSFPAPAEIKIDTGFEPWEVSNYDEKDYGDLDLVEATQWSVNTVYAQLITKVGARKTADTAKKLGVTRKMPIVPSLALGTAEVTPVELTSAYATLAARGMYAEPYRIQKIRDASGKTLFEHKEKPERRVEERVANTVTYALEQVVERGTGRSADLGRPTAGKTGTTENHLDAWFAGFTPDLATSVWMGFPEGKRTMERVRGIAVTGGSFPAQIWRAFMSEALKDVPPSGFGKPDFSGETVKASPSASPSPSPSPSPTITVDVPAPSPTSQPKGKPSPSASPSPEPSASPSPSPSPSPAQSAAPGGGGG